MTETHINLQLTRKESDKVTKNSSTCATNGITCFSWQRLSI